MDANTRRDNDDNDRSGREVVLEDVAAGTQDAMAAETRSLLTRLSMVQEKVRSVLLTLLLICHATAASLILTAHTDSALFPCDHPPLTSLL